MKNWPSILKLGLPLLLAASVLGGCVVRPAPVVVAPRPYYYHPYYGYHYYGYYGHGWGRW